LGADNKILSVHLPGGVDDIKEFADVASFPDPGEASIIYVALDTNVIYRWSGTAYVEISSSLALGQTSSTAFPGDRGLALETLTDNIVDGSQALALKDQIIRNTAVGTIPLVVNSIASTTANLTEFQVDGVKKLEVTKDGFLNQNGTRLFHQTGGTTNTFFGALNGGTATNGTNNTAFGRGSLFSLTSGGGNTSLGANSGLLIGTASFNTFVGNDAGNNASQLVTATNSTAIGNGSFTDKSNQMVFGNASVTEFKFDRNTGAVALLPQINATSSSNHIIKRTSTATTGVIANSRLIATTSGDMADTFGGAIEFGIEDNTALEYISYIGALRSGADNSGRLNFVTKNAGTYTEKMTILPDGKVGIGTASPVNVLSVISPSNTDGIQLRRNSTTTNDYARLGFAITTSEQNANLVELRAVRTNRAVSGDTDLSFFTNSNSALAERLRIRDDGNVGIGTSSPETKLHIQSSTNQFRLWSDSTANNQNATLSFSSSGNNSLDIRTNFVNTGNRITLSPGTTTAMTLLGDGNVGIGTSSPASLLEVSQALDGTTLRITSRQNDTSHSSATPFGVLEFYSADTSGAGAGNRGSIKVIPSGTSGATARMLFSTTSADTLDVERMRIDENGLVGINETTPTAQLQVKSGATNRVPLIINTLESHTANLAEWKLNGTNRFTIASNGDLDVFGIVYATNGLSNSSSSNNSRITPASTGTTISRNVADTNPALIVNLANASATGNIQVWQKAGSALSQISNAGIFVGQTRPTRTDITDNATLALADEGKVLRVNSSSNRTITIPKNSAVAFPIDTEIAILRYGSGTVSIAPVDGDVTLQSADGERKIKNRYGSVALKKIGTDEWVLVGSLEA
jgi:hypothetical protein